MAATKKATGRKRKLEDVVDDAPKKAPKPEEPVVDAAENEPESAIELVRMPCLLPPGLLHSLVLDVGPI